MTSPAHPRVATVARLLRRPAAPARCACCPAEVRTAAAAAAALGVPVGAIVNSLVFEAGRLPRAGPHQRRAPGRRGRRWPPCWASRRSPRAAPEFVRRHTGQAIGGVAPIGHPEPIGTLVDVELARYDVVWAAAGHPASVFPTTYEELLRLTAGTAAEVGTGPTDAPARRSPA